MFTARLTEVAGAVEEFFDQFFARALAPTGDPADRKLVEAMRYALRGGKRLRAYLVMESCRLHDIAPQHAILPAAAIEAMHAYSLVHDDLPCMDDDSLRRGLPTVHIAWDEATAVLAGDALQALAFELASDPALGRNALQLVNDMARAAGRSGMVGGQMMDIAAETAVYPLTLDQIETLQSAKTGYLFEFASCAGPILAGADPKALRQYAHHLGRAFQIADDILDIEGDVAKTGKAVGKDAAAGKATFVSLLGLAEAKQRASDLVDSACAALDQYGDRAESLRDAARFVISREY